MKIKNKIALVVLPILLLSLISINLVFGIFFQEFVLDLEASQINATKENLSSYLEEKRDKYIGNVNDWGHWDDTYDFVNARNEAYINENFIESTFENLDVSFIIVTDNNDRVVKKSYYSFEQQEITDFPAEFEKGIQSVFDFSGLAPDTYGIIKVGNEFYFMSATDVTDSAGFRDPNGKFVIGRLIDSQNIGAIEKITGCRIDSISLFSEHLPDVSQNSETVIVRDTVINDQKDAINISVIVPNQHDPNASVLFSLVLPRELYNSGIKKMAWFAGINTAASVVISVIIFVILGMYLTKPFGKLILEMKQIDLTKRDYVKLSDKGKDEISFIRKAVNQMLSKIEKSQNELIENQEKLQATLISVGDGVISVNKKGIVQFMNPVAEQLTGWSTKEALGKPMEIIFNIINEYTREPVESPVKAVFETEQIIELTNHTLLVSKDGIERPIEDTAAPIKNQSGKVTGCVLVFRDFSDKKEKQRRIEYLSYHDQLTGLYNRRYFEEELKRLDVKRNLPLSFLYLDVNGLKTINDAFGHQAGDQCIISVGEIFKSECRQDDIISRTGGDEFIILLPHTDLESVEKLAERIREKTAKIMIMNVCMSISLGWDTKVSEEQDAWGILKNAEDNMYQKKILEGASKRNGIIKSILNSLLVKNPREEAHSMRVSMICADIGRAYALKDHEIRELKTVGELHDIGKIAIDEAILDKAGPLSESEWAQIKKHPETGYRLLGTSNEFSNIAEYVFAHHERWDGTGYPKGLKGEDIPWKARIITIADAYDAMTTGRPYRKAFSREEAIAEIEKNSGTQFDPDIAKVFIEKVLK